MTAAPASPDIVSIQPSGAYASEPERWFVVQTQPSREAGAAMQLRAQGFRPFLPMMRKTIRWRARLRNVVAPMFPRYLFVPIDPQRGRWRCINGTFGVVRLVSFGDRPHPTPVGLVEGMLALSDEQGLVQLERNFKPGERVKVATGPFTDVIGECERLDGHGRVRVLLNIMGGSVAVSLDRESLIAV